MSATWTQKLRAVAHHNFAKGLFALLQSFLIGQQLYKVFEFVVLLEGGENVAYLEDDWGLVWADKRLNREVSTLCWDFLISLISFVLELFIVIKDDQIKSLLSIVWIVERAEEHEYLRHVTDQNEEEEYGRWAKVGKGKALDGIWCLDWEIGPQAIQQVSNEDVADVVNLLVLKQTTNKP